MSQSALWTEADPVQGRAIANSTVLLLGSVGLSGYSERDILQALARWEICSLKPETAPENSCCVCAISAWISEKGQIANVIDVRTAYAGQPRML